jgi:hypothetical protein
MAMMGLVVVSPGPRGVVFGWNMALCALWVDFCSEYALARVDSGRHVLARRCSVRIVIEAMDPHDDKSDGARVRLCSRAGSQVCNIACTNRCSVCVCRTSTLRCLAPARGKSGLRARRWDARTCVCRAGESEATGVRYGRVGARSVGRSDFFAFAAGDGSMRWFEAWGDALDLGLVITGSWSTAYFKSLFLHFLI